MDNDKFRVDTYDMKVANSLDLQHHLDPDLDPDYPPRDENFSSGSFTEFHAVYTFFVHYSEAIAGAVGMKVLDVLADRVKEWWKTRPPENPGLAVRLYGPNGEVATW